MNVLILGSGGREHTLAWKVAQSPLCNKLIVAPGNAGTASVATNMNLELNDFDQIAQCCLNEAIDMVIVGPEAPLVDGIYDYFNTKKELQHIRLIGPSKEGAQLEGSKAYAKKFMQRHDIPTAGYAEFSKDTETEAFEYIDKSNTPIVLKCDGLAAGKGVLILDDKEEAKQELAHIFNGKFGGAGHRVVIEDFLDGIEFSVFVLTDGNDYKILPVAKDYKRIGTGDQGLNTGGMGAVSPPPFVDEQLMDKVIKRIVQPTVQGLKKENIDYKGFIFIGLIRVENEPYVIEYNCRMGDPETEVVIPRIESDFLELLAAFNSDDFKHLDLKIKEEAAATVMLVSGGYPEAYEKGKVMEIPADSNDSIYFHAGTKVKDDMIVTNGGRVLAITSFDHCFKNAVKKSMHEAERINFEGKYYRNDIGFDL